MNSNGFQNGNRNGQTMIDTANAPRILFNETEVTFRDARPGMVNGQLMVPLRAFAEQMGATVHWRHNSKELVLEMPNQQTIQLMASPQMTSSMSAGDQGRAQTFAGANSGNASSNATSGGSNLGSGGSAQVIVINDRAYVPFDQLATVLNGTGNWDRTGGSATITVDPNRSGTGTGSSGNNGNQGTGTTSGGTGSTAGGTSGGAGSSSGGTGTTSGGTGTSSGNGGGTTSGL